MTHVGSAVVRNTLVSCCKAGDVWSRFAAKANKRRSCRGLVSASDSLYIMFVNYVNTVRSVFHIVLVTVQVWNS